MNIRQTIKTMALLFMGMASAHAQQTYTFGVTNQRTPLLTAEYWNPILLYITKKSHVPLTLKMGRGSAETAEMIHQGAFDFVYSNHIFQRQNQAAGYRVFARPMEQSIRGEIVTLPDGPIRTLADLNGKDVAFPSKWAFVGYAVPITHLKRAQVRVKAVFASNQEGAMGQLRAHQVSAAGVNSEIMRDFAKREHFHYRIIWASVPYLNLPIAAQARVPADKIQAVKQAFLQMAKDPEGARILKASAQLVKQKGPLGFIAADDKEYENQKEVYSRMGGGL
jgi:phosphonate transport system substrate-binding protein